MTPEQHRPAARCPLCRGLGIVRVRAAALSFREVTCPECHGARPPLTPEEQEALAELRDAIAFDGPAEEIAGLMKGFPDPPASK